MQYKGKNEKHGIKKKMTTILITGSSGFIGANLCRYFSEKNYSVIAIKNSRSSWRLPKNLHSPHLKVVSLDLTNEKRVRSFLKKTQPKIIFNLAAYGAYSNQTEQNRIYRVNFDAVRFLLEGAREIEGFKAFVQAGSSSEYGVNCSAPLESDWPLPDSHYAVAKVNATHLIQYYALKYQLPAWAFRLYSVYGPYEEVSRLIPKLLLHAREQKLPPLVNPNISRDFIYVNDVAQAFEKLIKKAHLLPKGEVYNIGSGHCVTLKKLVDIAKHTFDISEMPQWGSMPDRHWDHPDWYSNPQKAQRDLNWKPVTSLESGLKKTMEWIQNNSLLIKKANQCSVLQTSQKKN